MQNKNHSASVVTLGCRANQYESNAIANALEKRGFVIVSSDETADICIINTCTVTAESDRKSRQMIRRAAKKAKHIIVTGCFSEISPDKALSIEGVDLVISNKVKSKVADAAEALVNSAPAFVPTPVSFESCNNLTESQSDRVRAYIKIEDGCDNNCSYCIIPKARGPVRSKDPDIILSEARSLAENGIKEVILTGIEISKYGSDLTPSIGLVDIIEQLSGVEGLERISVGSLDPKYLSPNVIDRIALIPGFTHHLHLSLQSGCSETLKSMRRKYNAEQILSIIGNIKNRLPDCMISVDIIAGFPGESDDDFGETVDFLKKIAPFHIHSFPYSPRPDTEAADMPSQIPEAVKKERNAVLCRIDKEISRSLSDEYVRAHAKDDHVSVLCESVTNGVGSGHSEHFVEVQFPADNEDVGKMLKVRTARIKSNSKNSVVIGEKVL